MNVSTEHTCLSNLQIMEKVKTTEEFIFEASTSIEHSMSNDITTNKMIN